MGKGRDEKGTVDSFVIEFFSLIKIEDFGS